MSHLVFPHFGSGLKFFDELLNTQEKATRSFTPACTIVERDKEFMISMDLAGFDKTAIAIDYHQGVLTISGKRDEESSEPHVIVHLNERGVGQFKRSFAIKDVQEDAIQAHFEQGVLRVLLPKKEEAKARKITISDESEGLTAQGTTPNQPKQ